LNTDESDSSGLERRSMRKDKVVTEMLGEDLAITPSDVCDKKFRRVLTGGYDRRQVDRFLERVADAIERLLDQVRTLKSAQQEQKTRIEEYRDMETTLRTALSSSQKLAEDILSAARREAQAMLEETHAKQAQIELEARRLPDALRREIQLLEQQRDRLRTELGAVLDTHKNLLASHLSPTLGPPPSFTNLGFLAGPAAGSAESPIFASDAAEALGTELPEAMVFETDDDELPDLEEPSEGEEELTSSTEPDATENDK
jgi:DivIVA domain-containing protein